MFETTKCRIKQLIEAVKREKRKEQMHVGGGAVEKKILHSSRQQDLGGDIHVRDEIQVIINRYPAQGNAVLEKYLGRTVQ